MNKFNQSIQKMIKYYKIGGGVYCFFASIIYKKNRVIYSCDIPPQANIGKVYFMHKGLGIVINKYSSIGDNVTIQHGVTLGTLKNEKDAPTIEDDVFIGAKATILGDIIIGKGARIGAGAVVLNDIKAGATVVGVPAKIVKEG